MRAKSLLVGSLLIVWQLGCGGAPLPGSRQVGSSSPNQQPNISISPASTIAGSADLTITITASKAFTFAGGHIWENRVLWSANGSETELSATLVSSSQLTAIVPSTLLAIPIQAKLRVDIWDHIEGTLGSKSSSVTFTVTPTPVLSPSISSISPSTVAAGSPDLTITINGSNFGHYGHFIWSTAFWTTNGNLHDTGTWLQTTNVSNSQLTAVIPTNLLKSSTSVQILVMNGDVMGMSDGYFGYPRSNSMNFTVTP